MSSRVKQLISRGTILAVMVGFLVSTVAAQPVQAQSTIVGKLRCAAIKTYSGATFTAIKVKSKVMESSFKLSLQLLDLKWKIEDAITNGKRKAAESLFLGLLKVYEKIRAKTAEKVAAVDKYRVDKLLALSLFHDDYDAANSAYREDFLALIKAHQQKLRDLVTELKTELNAAITEAMTKCDNLGVLISLTGDVVQAKANYIKGVTNDNIKTIVKGTQLRVDRNFEILRQIAVLLKKCYQLRVEMTDVIRGWN